MAEILPLSDEEDACVKTYIREFSDQCLQGPMTGYDCIYRSHAFADTRSVVVLHTSSQAFALKIDTTSPSTERLKNEFELLSALHQHFDGNETSRVVRPVYLSQGGEFLVTEYIDRPTAVDLIYNSADDNQVAQVYRRAGSWLNDLHARHPPTRYAFKPRWMTDSLSELIQAVPRDIANQSRAMVDEMLAEGARLKGTEDLRVFSHGDFHGQNLIVGQGKTIGLDFTEARDKLAVYDIVDFLKADIFRETVASEVDRSGILRRNKEMFFRLYRHPINHEILDYCIRGRLLKDWLFLHQITHTCSAFERDRRSRLWARLNLIFD
ncbi:aminoglycoside phosphotransferase family protein [Ruegeria arenilitoris]|uniref:aminoglycoside phosphotransferase family protein n=1 Tax=Ruegeria arenilitoris TaxID=1173585 RepID=UPI00147A51C1|nr:aminoglycoside phosphotransferase family protein [Ruegeria arenilitoris]